MKMKKEFVQQDSIGLVLCVLFPPLGYFLAARRGWIGTGIALIASLLYAGAVFGLVRAGYPSTANDLVILSALWGVVMAVAISGKYVAARSVAIGARGLLLLVLGLFVVQYTPRQGIDCLMHCSQITMHNLRGVAIALAPGVELMLFLASLYALLALALFLSVFSNDD
jgi:hypothetical protein